MEFLKSKFKIAILGPGGVGGLLAILSKNAGHHVICVNSSDARSNTEDFLELNSVTYGNHRIKFPFTGELADPVDIIFLTVKAPFLKAAIDRVLPSVKKNAVVISLLNGIGHEDLIRKHFTNVIIGTIGLVETERIGKTLIKHRSKNQARIELSQNKLITKKNIFELEKFLNSLGLTTSLQRTEMDVVWNKLSRLCPIASATSYYQTKLGEILLNPESLNVLEELVKEVSMVAFAHGYKADPYEIKRQIEKLPFDLQTSLQKDLMNKRTSELEAILGEVKRRFASNYQSNSTLEKIYLKLTNMD